MKKRTNTQRAAHNLTSNYRCVANVADTMSLCDQIKTVTFVLISRMYKQRLLLIVESIDCTHRVPPCIHVTRSCTHTQHTIVVGC